jgi:hypothetical protein
LKSVQPSTRLLNRRAKHRSIAETFFMRAPKQRVALEIV